MTDMNINPPTTHAEPRAASPEVLAALAAVKREQTALGARFAEIEARLSIEEARR